MSNPSEPDLLDLVVPYAMDAVSDVERADIEQRVAGAPRLVADAFRAQVAEVRESMAALSATTAATPPAGLRDRVLAGSAKPDRGTRRRYAVLAAAAALVVAGGAFAAGWVSRPWPSPPVAERVLTAPDVRAVSTGLRSGGTATVVYSRERGNGILVLDGATAPPPGMGYRVWLMKDGVPVPAGSAAGDARTVMVADIGPASALGLTVEPLGAAGTAPPADMVGRVVLP